MDGWRYLSLKPAEIYAITPREFTLLMRSENERRQDDYEMQATLAMWHRAAYHAPKLKVADLYKRDSSKQSAKKSTEELKADFAEKQSKLDRLTFVKKDGEVTDE